MGMSDAAREALEKKRGNEELARVYDKTVEQYQTKIGRWEVAPLNASTTKERDEAMARVEEIVKKLKAVRYVP
jgi:uncharacterized coiled-coil DUF342 family protein